VRRYLPFRNKALVQIGLLDRSLFIKDRSLFIKDRSLFIKDRSLFEKDRSLFEKGLACDGILLLLESLFEKRAE